MNIPITLKINSLNCDILEIETCGIFIYINKKYYMVTIHQGLPVKEIIFNIKDIQYNFTNFIICGWNDLIILPIERIQQDLFFFKHFVKKQIIRTTKFMIDNNNISYCENEFIPINMMPGNPSNLYYKMKSLKKIIHDGDCGKPIIDSNQKLIGIACKTNDIIIYVIPTIYILQSINKIDNTTIFSINYQDSINKIDKYKVKENNTIYSRKINSLIPIDTYIVLEGDIDKEFTLVIKYERIVYIKVKPFVNLISNSTDINIKNDIIYINSCFIHMMKLCYKDNRIIQTIFKNINKCKQFEYIINKITYNLLY